jgi:hypothetical protein
LPNLLTRQLNTGGPYGSVPGAAPPYHAAQNNPAEQALGDARLSRLSGQDETLNTSGWVGYSSRPGGDQAAYRGRDLSDPESWNGRPYNESSGMFARLAQEMPSG